MTCKKVQEWLSLYPEGVPGWWVRRRVAAHLQECATCRREHAALLRTVALVRTYAREQVPRDLCAPVMAAISAQPRRALRSPLARPILLVPASLAVLVALTLQVSLRGTAPPTAYSTSLPKAYVREYANFQASQEVGAGASVFLVLSELSGGVQ